LMVPRNGAPLPATVSLTVAWMTWPINRAKVVTSTPVKQYILGKKSQPIVTPHLKSKKRGIYHLALYVTSKSIEPMALSYIKSCTWKGKISCITSSTEHQSSLTMTCTTGKHLLAKHTKYLQWNHWFKSYRDQLASRYIKIWIQTDHDSGSFRGNGEKLQESHSISLLLQFEEPQISPNLHRF
jgi:hypothetical protein